METLSDRLSEIDANQRTILALRPLAEPELRQLRDYCRIGLTWSGNAIEGNTLSESETKVVLEDGLTIGGKTVREHQETLGLAKAFDAVWALRDKEAITEEDARALHSVFYGAIDAGAAGVYRTVRVFVSGSHYPCPPPERVPAAMSALFKEAAARRAALHPVCFAAWLRKAFVFIHPFVDGNGRVARLLMNMALFQRGHPATLVPPVLRHEYYAALEQARADEETFFRFIAGCHLEAQRDYLRLLS
jgi:Fic family protein